MPAHTHTHPPQPDVVSPSRKTLAVFYLSLLDSILFPRPLGVPLASPG